MQHEQFFTHQPFVDAESAVEPARAVVGHHQHDRVLVQQLEHLTDLLVEVQVVVADHVLERGIGLVQHMFGIVVLPEPVMHPVEPDIHALEIVPVLSRRVVPHHGPELPAHPED